MAKDEKFIMMNLDDDRSKKVAEAISNPTCKKILNYLAENKDKSEEDIAKDLAMPINTVEYNLKKLLESGLIEKSKNFFWSKRGKKINLYKPANRHIIISPKSKRPNMDVLKTILPVIIALVVVVAAVLLLSNPPQEQTASNDFKTFSSLSELKDFLKENQEAGAFYGGIRGTTAEEFSASDSAAVAGTAESADAPQTKSSADDYSITNIQVEGVDEADIVKNDGKYIYVLSGKKLVIINAFPAEQMEILSETNISDYPIEIFVNGDKLSVFTNSYGQYGNTQETKSLVFDITDRENPILEDEFSINGNYLSSRMIGNYVYLISSQYAYLDNVILPAVRVDGITKEVPITDIAYFPYPDTSYVFTNILAFNINNGRYETQTYLTGASYTVYVSENNIYLTYTKQMSQQAYFKEMVKEVIIPLVPSNIGDEILEIMTSKENRPFYERTQEISTIVQDYSNSLRGAEKSEFDQRLQEKTQEFFVDLQKRSEKTVIHKIKIDELDIEYLANGEVPGHLLNQFSMDENKDYFRIATTTGNTWGSASSLSHMYVLDENLEIAGSVEDLAKGERIYSTRFMGDRAYMVTFRQVDPLFVVDLSNPSSPEVLGQLKVTGFSNYLHPYDENHIIGIGKEASEEGRVQGLKIALFDVSDVSNPIEKAKYEVKQQWSDSNALYEHKAFLFDKKRELLILPVTYSEPSEEIINEWGRYWNYNYWQGAFVFNINEDEITLRGKIDHEDNVSENYYYSYAVQRSLFMDETLYTISQKMVKANDLSSLAKISSVELPYEQQYGGPYYAESGVGVVGRGVAVPEGVVK
ncbi:beta-propeller domain-containing protein [Candidatus Pacearchaeota archaeon]|nr:beta-propeller domain-containing protein [Candidatus Pacearchaeota archaeon]